MTCHRPARTLKFYRHTDVQALTSITHLVEARCTCAYNSRNFRNRQISCISLFFTGMVKVNFSGGEPFLPKRGKYLGEMVKFCKETLHLPSVSIVSNGSLITESWFQEFGEYLDILAISCDSFNADVNERIGRQQGSSRDHLRSLLQVREWCRTYKVSSCYLTIM